MASANIRALALHDATPPEDGRCVACAAPLATFAPARGRDGRRDGDSFFTDRFCSHHCYHAYARRVGGPGATAAWN